MHSNFNSEEMTRDLLEYLNNARHIFKKRALTLDTLGQLAVQEILQTGCSQNDLKYKHIIEKYRMNHTDIHDYLVFERQQLSSGLYHTPQELKDGFERAFDDMINTAYKPKLLTGHSMTHISIGLQQYGSKGEFFKIATLTSKCPISIEEVIRCTSQSESGLIFVGKILDATVKPCLLTINRGRNDQIVVGPNRMLYSPDLSEEFRISLPDNYLGPQVSVQHILSQLADNVFQLFVIQSNDSTFAYGQGNDMPQNFNDVDNFQIGCSGVLPQYQKMKTLISTVTSGLTMKDIGKSGGTQSRLPFQKAATSTRPPPISNSATTLANNLVSQGGIRKTRTQILREQKIAEERQNQNQQQQQQQPAQQLNTFSQPSSQPPFKFQATLNQQQQLPQQQQQQQQPSSAFNFVQTSKENYNPNQATISNQFNAPKSNQPQFKFQTTSQTTNNNNAAFQTNNGQNNTNFQSNQYGNAVQPTQLQPFKIAFNNGNSGQQPQSLPSNTNTQIIWPSQKPANQIQQQQQQQQQPQAPAYQPNPSLQFQPQITTPKVTFKNNPQAASLTQVQPTRLIFSQQQQQYQQPQVQQQQQQPLNYNFTQQQQINAPQQQYQQCSFNQLTQIDQDILKGYLSEISQVLTADKQLKIQQLMQTDPIQFAQYFWKAHSEFQQIQKDQKEMQEAREKERREKEALRSRKLVNLNNLYLFLITLSPELQGQNQEKFKQLLQKIEVKETKPDEALSKLIIKSKCMINESFKDLFNDLQSADLLVLVGKDDFYCHQVVFAANSDYFKKVIQKNMSQIRQFQHYDGALKPQLEAPEWMDAIAFKLLIKFLYTGRIGDSKQLPPQADIMNLLKIANFFYLDYLQESLIADAIIPYIDATNVLAYLKECVVPSTIHKNTPKHAWEFLKEYCLFFVSRNLPLIIKKSLSQLQTFDIEELRDVVERSLYFIQEGTSDLEVILKFAASILNFKDIFDVFRRCQCKFDKCSAFDFQSLPEMSEFIRQTDATIAYQCKLTQGKEQIFIQTGNAPTTNTVKNNNQKSLNATFIPAEDIYDINGTSEIDFNSWKPSFNMIKDVNGKQELGFTDAPSFQAKISLSGIKDQLSKNQGGTIITEAFDYGRRCWSLKLDIDVENNLSIWIVERGFPIYLEDNTNISLNVPIQISSILAEISLTDSAIGDRKSSIFFSFSHDSNQVVGHRNFINLNQLANKQYLEIKIQMKEFLLHSAIMHHLTSNFYTHFKNEFTYLKNCDRARNDCQIPHGLLKLPFFTVFAILSSNQLQVEDEKTVLSFIFHYVQRFGERYPHGVQLICDILVHTLRFQYLPISKILSAIRDNRYLRENKSFIFKVKEEMISRSKLSQPLKEIQVQSDQFRNNYDPQKIFADGRKKYEHKIGSSLQGMTLLEEVLEWAVNSKHQKNNDLEIVRLQSQLAEERQLIQKLKNELAQAITMPQNYQQQQTNIRMQHHQYGRPLQTNRLSIARNNSLDNRKSNNIGYASPGVTPKFFDDTLHLVNSKRKHNNSFCGESLQNMLMDETFKRGQRANQLNAAKLNPQQNITMILDNIINQQQYPQQQNQQQQNKPQTSQVIPYYKQVQKGKGGSTNNGGLGFGFDIFKLF